MTQLDLGRLGVWGHLDSLAAPDAIAYARRADALGYGTLWVPETVGREPIALLALIAGATDAINLGTSIVNIWGRDAQSARMAAQTIAEASGGRFVLGLGVSHPHLAEKLRGHQFARPLSRMREYLAAYRAAVYRGPSVDGAPEPPLMIAALRERMVDLAANRCRWRPALPRHRGASRLDARAAGCRRRWGPPAAGGHAAGGHRRARMTARRRAPISSPTCARRPTGVVGAPGLRLVRLGTAGKRSPRRRHGRHRLGRPRSGAHRRDAGGRRRSRCDHSAGATTGRPRTRRPSNGWPPHEAARVAAGWRPCSLCRWPPARAGRRRPP